jgi:hypothetical protein
LFVSKSILKVNRRDELVHEICKRFVGTEVHFVHCTSCFLTICRTRSPIASRIASKHSQQVRGLRARVQGMNSRSSFLTQSTNKCIRLSFCPSDIQYCSSISHTPRYIWMSQVMQVDVLLSRSFGREREVMSSKKINNCNQSRERKEKAEVVA